MNKKMMMIIAVLAIAGGAYFFLGQDKEEATEQENEVTGAVWNPYAEEGAHIVTLSDSILSASGGKYIVKMTNTIKFTNEESYYRFKGYESVAAAKEAANADSGGHGGGDEVHVTPMEIKINATISDLMLRANEKQILDVEMLKNYLIEGINTKLGFGEPIIGDMFIENYVIQ